MSLDVSVVVAATRPDAVRTCLEHLAAVRTRPTEILVVDATADGDTPLDATSLDGTDLPDVHLLRSGRGGVSAAHQVGLTAATGDVVAFLDEDAVVDVDWLDELVAPYADPAVVGVGGRVSHGIPGEEREGLGEIGRLLPDGRLTGNFAADPGRPVVVDHLPGANMSFRRSALVAIGGIRGDYPGGGEAADVALRLAATGGRLVLSPRALVRQAAAPQPTAAQRYDRRHLYDLRRDHVVLLVRAFGWRAPVLRRYVRTVLRTQRDHAYAAKARLRPRYKDGRPRSLARRIFGPGYVATRSLAEVAGLVAGFPAAALARRQDRADGAGTPAA